MSRPEVTNANLLEALSLFSHYMREAWRLQNQAINGRGPLPDHLQASQRNALKDLKRLVSLDGAYGGNFKGWLTEAITRVQQDYGDLHLWVEEDVTTASSLEWQALTAEIRYAIDEAHNAVRQGRIPSEINWEPAGRASISLSFALRAAEKLSQAVEEGALPKGVRVCKRFHAKSPILQVHVVDENDKKIGVSDHLEGAVKEAIAWRAAAKQTHEMTPEEFVATATVVNVDLGRGKTGKAKSGPQRLLFEAGEDADAMRSFLLKALERVSGEDTFRNDPEASQLWIDNALTTIMSTPFNETLKVLRMEGAGHLILNRSGGMHIDANELKKIHRRYVEVAFHQGEEVPERVLAAVGLQDDNDRAVARPRQTA